jgi:hypothetical protein
VRYPELKFVYVQLHYVTIVFIVNARCLNASGGDFLISETRVLRLQMEERAANILNKQSWTADQGQTSNLGVA